MIGTCQVCETKTKHLEQHHIIPKSRGGSDKKDNLINLCTRCHGKAHDVSFKNERGGLIKEGFLRNKIQHEIDKEWLIENDNLVNKKMDEIYEKDKQMHMKFLMFIESHRVRATQLRELCEKGKIKIKTSFTFF